ncbi:TetR/AcrR family transcriptional regulator [Amycolatopsis sp. cmx-4-61]|uniref:TetR/AcrR family transcriptional regulator n=1 Tax=Amycolatopsis sp. cmx-4-61 TaxID=2790937 RepID=UPI003978C120
MAAPETDPAPPATRRHGAALEAAILDAGWDELAEIGYARLTMGSIAKRARTSEPVLYRRWANKDELVLAVLDRYRATHPVAVPDTGDLRDDLIHYLTALGDSLAGFFAIAAAAAFSGLLAATGLSPADIRAQAMGDQLLPQTRTIYRQAAARGELDPEGIPPAVLALPFDLVRHDLLMDLEPPGAERVRSIVDEMFLPLVRAHRTS